MKVDYINDSKKSEEEVKEKKDAPRRILVGSSGKTMNNIVDIEGDVLIVASKLKKYIKDKHGLSTSANVMERLSDIIRVQCDRAVENAMKEGRKTLMDRDF